MLQGDWKAVLFLHEPMIPKDQMMLLARRRSMGFINTMRGWRRSGNAVDNASFVHVAYHHEIMLLISAAVVGSILSQLQGRTIMLYCGQEWYDTAYTSYESQGRSARLLQPSQRHAQCTKS